MDTSLRQQVRETTHVIGERIRKARHLRGVTQSDLAAALGVTFQQVQKYENGVNSVSVSTLLAIAAAIGVDIDFFLPTGGRPIGRTEIEEIRAEVASAINAAGDAILKIADMRDRLQEFLTRLPSPADNAQALQPAAEAFP